MLVEPKKDIFSQLIKEATHDELVWMNGFLAGLLSQSGGNLNSQSGVGTTGNLQLENAKSTSLDKLTILYASETGNAKSVATKLAANSKKKGVKTKLAAVEQYRIGDLAKEKNLLLAISTQGDGEPPISAVKFYHAIHEEQLKLPNLRFGVLALGDSSYPLFCQAGMDVDKQLELRGGKRIVPLQKCDTDYEAVVEPWFESAVKLLSGESEGSATVEANVPLVKTNRSSHKKIYSGKVLANFNLNDVDSAKQTHHIEIAADELDYLPGDALGVVPANPAALVHDIIALTGLDGTTQIEWREDNYELESLLKEKAQIIYLPERVVKKYAEIAGQEIPDTRINLIDLLKIYPLKNEEDFLQVAAVLEPIAPRLYSISSSPEAHGDEIHITVAKDNFYVGDKQEIGLCSGYLTELPEESEFSFYIHPNKAFRMPEADKDVIMIGPGTGIAPFRSFLFERDATGAAGRNWLFFGDQHITSDFLYQTEIQSFLDTGVLTRFNAAFSRDQEEKVYVQHKLQQHAAEVFEWLEQGAYIYICGSKDPMSFDVERKLTEIIATQKEISMEEAEKYISLLWESGRILKDVY